jgi:hypothetical protein
MKQGIPELGLSLEKGTATVPTDGQFHVILNGEVMFSSKSKLKALEEYRQQRDQLLAKHKPERWKADPKEALRRLVAQGQAERMLAESARRKRAGALRRGGNTGRRSTG